MSVPRAILATRLFALGYSLFARLRGRALQREAVRLARQRNPGKRIDPRDVPAISLEEHTGLTQYEEWQLEIELIESPIERMRMRREIRRYRPTAAQKERARQLAGKPRDRRAWHLARVA